MLKNFVKIFMKTKKLFFKMIQNLDFSKMRWKAPRQNITQKFCQLKNKPFKKCLGNNDRKSFQTKLSKKCMKNGSLIKFPSQKALIPKQKAILLKPCEKENHFFQVYRMLKQYSKIKSSQIDKEHQEFLQVQAKKIKQFKNQINNPKFTFNYDGTIIKVYPPKENKNQIIQCIGEQLKQIKVEAINQKKQSIDMKNTIQFHNRYAQIHQFSSEYFDNFYKIKWNPKITLTGDKENIFVKQMPVEKLSKEEIWKRDRSRTLAIDKKCDDEKSKIKIANPQILAQVLLPTSIMKYKRQQEFVDNCESKITQAQFFQYHNGKKQRKNTNKNLETHIRSLSANNLPKNQCPYPRKIQPLTQNQRFLNRRLSRKTAQKYVQKNTNWSPQLKQKKIIQ